MGGGNDITRRALFERLARLQGGPSPRRSARPNRALPRRSQTPEHPGNGRFTRRLLLMGAGQLALFGLLAARLSNLQKIEGRKYRSLAEENRLAVRFEPSVRGRIFDRTGALVAANQENLRALIVPDQAENIATSLDLLAEVVRIEESDKRRVMATARRQNPQLPILIRGQLNWEQFARINVLGPRLPGIITDISWRRQYPFGEDFAHILGHLGPPDRLQIATEPALRATDMRVGVSGLELGFDETLRGRPAQIDIEVDARGKEIRSLARTPASAGRDLRLSIDHQLQKRILQRINAFRRAAAVAIDVTSGEVVASCSTPSFDPNILSDPIEQDEWEALRRAEDDPMTDKATRGQYPPGSTFKMVTALAGLEAGVITPESHVTCSGEIVWSGQKFRCWNRTGHGVTDLHKAIKQSCDVYFYDVALKVGITRLARMAHVLGLGQSYDCGLPGQKPGLIPDPDWKRVEKNRAWLGGETLLAGIGQGYVLTTPLQLAVMTARIASGRLIQPRFVAASADEPRLAAQPLPISATSLALVRRAMTAVINDADGTAVRAALDWPGLLMAGKTGTSQVSSNSRRVPGRPLEWKLRDHALFVAYAPADQPRYALSLIIEHGESGGSIAGPVAADIMKMLLIRDPAYRLSALATEAQADKAVKREERP